MLLEKSEVPLPPCQHPPYWPSSLPRLLSVLCLPPLLSMLCLPCLLCMLCLTCL